MNLLFLNYNNYYNRTIKRLTGKESYVDACKNKRDFFGIQFNPGDGIYTEQIVNWHDDFTPDYVVCFDEETEAIVSRWFVLEWKRTRTGQYNAQLRRDVIADNYETVINSPIFVEKGYINDMSNPLLYNSESMEFNQIKQQEEPLQDETKCGWVVGYIPSDAFTKFEEGKPQYKRVEKDIPTPLAADITVSSLDKWEYWKYCTNNSSFKYLANSAGRRKIDVKIRSEYLYNDTSRSAAKDLITADYTFYPNSDDAGEYRQVNQGTIKSTTGNWNYPQWYTSYGPVTYQQGALTSNACNTIFRSVLHDTTFNTNLNTVLGSAIDIGDTTALRSLADKVILDSSTNSYYKIRISEVSETNPMTINSSVTGGQAVLDALNSAMTRSVGLTTVAGNYTNIVAANSSPSYAIQLINVGISVYVDLDSDRLHLEDAPYDMFCIPYSDTLSLYDGTNTFKVSKNVALGIATEIARDLGDQSVYDVQLLPYCPNRTLVINSTNPSSTLDLTKVKYDLIKESSTDAPKSAIVWCTSSNFQININVEPQRFVTPFKNVSSGINKLDLYTWYLLKNYPTDGVKITANDNQTLEAKLVNKTTGKVIKTFDFVDSIEFVNTAYVFHTININKNGSAVYSVIKTLYQASNAYIIFRIVQNKVTYTDLAGLIPSLKIPTISGFSLEAGKTAEERKISNETELFRLSSGNYNGIFEFSVAKSGGIDGFIADCTYKPWMPYVHILPKLKGLYGDNFVDIDDARGLIIGGDYSLPQLSNAWANYQLQNKTYNEVFIREVKHIDITNDISKMGVIADAIAAPFTGAVAGGVAGSKFGPYGAIAGAAVGAVGGAATGALDAANAFKLMEENKQYAIDMYNYNLQNIQAIPTSLTKTSALTWNTRIWPFIEYYNCTSEEKEALIEKLKYNGMTIMKIGKLNEYTLGESRYYKGKIIRLLDFDSDSHLAYEIYNELDKGVYL